MGELQHVRRGAVLPALPAALYIRPSTSLCAATTLHAIQNGLKALKV
jgi:hypothetical protein